MKIHSTDEYGNIVKTMNVPHSAIIETTQGNTYEVAGTPDLKITRN